ncbi:HNH endonuclease [Singulisphaera sp. GP187]|uniref:RNA-guided endonuclease IscB n=1 Tax=Singulisphaera sp. GP187 TaxID=1882752 RepID=UPI0009273D6C|nr:RNA-guided endonuclease IscB [Singulisphaera sp. GP187]SIO43152.1 HNH endonuclease [Singulisphaera sp. GP187]
MLAFVLNHKGEPLMPCSPAKARHLLKQGKAKVIRRDPFTIKLLFGASGYRQEVVAGMDAGSKSIGAAAVANGKVVYQAEVQIRDDVSGKMKQRVMYRRNRRSRKTRYRPARWNNRAAMRADGRLAPSIRSKIESHLRERNFIASILPVTRWKVELASFDTHKITNLAVDGAGYQDGAQKGYYNIKAYVLHRDDYACQSGRKVKHSQKLNVHHVTFRSNGGTDTPSNLLTLCESCHDDLHAGKFVILAKKSKTKHATEIGIVKASLKKSGWSFEEMFGYETKYKREQCLGWPKSHAADAVAICCGDGEVVEPRPVTYRKRHVSKGDYQQTSGKRGEKRTPTGKLFGLRKFDLVESPKGVGFVKGKRSSGYFAIATLDGIAIHNSAKATACKRIAARSTTLTTRIHAAPSHA